MCCFFFFKQKTAYEIKECDWSSDVCSSDLGSNSFTLFECFMPDVIGHHMDMQEAKQFLPVLDRMLAGIMEEKDESVTLILSSDHGNIEDLSKKPHTTNPVPLLVMGKHATAFADAENITEIGRAHV